MSKKLETNLFSKLFLISLLLLALPLAACGSLTDSAAAAPTNQTAITVPVDSAAAEVIETAPMSVESTAVQTMPDTGAVDNTADALLTADLSGDEIADLLFMREEEKLARDVYLALYELWGIPVFQNIAASEQAHMDALLSLINQYGLEDPVAGNGMGIFSDPSLQALYEQLIVSGSQSAAYALFAGAAVEEIDILDLQGSLAQTHNDNIVAVYPNLLAGSENHLRAFVPSWERQTGEAYQPQYLNEDEYADIMGESQGGNGQGQGGNGQGQGGNGQGQGGNGQGQGSQGGIGNRGQGGQGKGRGGNGGNIDNGLGGPGGRGQQSTTE